MLHCSANHDVPSRNGGFTLVELLVVITIIGTLIGMLLPAVNSARETGRSAQCKNNLKQMGTACLAHEEAQGTFPTGGWGWYWVGDPDCGYGSNQPGGWLYNILPHTEMNAVHDQQFVVSGQSISGKTIAGQSPNNSMKQQAIIQMVGTPLPFTNCPTRRRPALFASACGLYNSGGVSMPGNSSVARTDYAANCGDGWSSQLGGGPTDNSATAQSNYFGTRLTSNMQTYTGICFERSTIRKDDITDGLSQTIMLGEKYLAPNCYGSGQDGADNENMYVGFDNDIFRISGSPGNYDPPKQDRLGNNDGSGFGSAHSTFANFVLCDGSVIGINYSVDPETFRRLTTRSEYPPAPIDMSKLGL